MRPPVNLLSPAMRVILVLAVASGVSGLPAQAEYQAFVAQFTKAMGFNDERGMDRATRAAPRWVPYHYEAVYRQWLRDQSQVDRRQLLRAMNASFKRVFETDTLEMIARYWDDMDDERTAMFDKGEANWGKLEREWEQVTKERNSQAMRKVLEQAMEMARRFEELGHALKAAYVWDITRTYYDALPDRSLADRNDAVNAGRRFVANRKLWHWTKDTRYYGIVNWVKGQEGALQEEAKKEKERKEAGFKEETKGPEAYIIPKSTEELGKLEFKPLHKPLRSCFIRSGPIPVFWMWGVVGEADGEPRKLGRFRRSDLFLVRTGTTKFGVTWDGATKDLEQNPWQPIEAPNKISKKPSVFYLDKGKRFQYAMWFYTGSEQEPVCGLVTNLAPQQKVASIYYRSAASWETTLNGVKVTFLDDNADGKLFAEDPMAYDWKERTLGFGDEEKPVPCYDSMIIGKGKPVPYSSWVKLDDKWFYLREAGGTEIQAGVRPVHTDFFKVGTVQMNFAGSKARPTLLIVRGKDAFRNAAFDISSGKPVEVPVGEYTIDYGRVIQGKGSRVITADIFAGDSKPIEVKEGKNTVVEVGAPFKVDFETATEQGFIVVDSTKFKVKGRGGEHYARISGGVAAPEVLYGKTPDGKGAKTVGHFIPLSDPEMLNKAGDTMKAAGLKIEGIGPGFFAAVKGDRDYSTKLKFTPKFPDGHVGLRQTKHKLFGKLEPNFK